MVKKMNWLYSEEWLRLRKMRKRAISRVAKNLDLLKDHTGK